MYCRKVCDGYVKLSLRLKCTWIIFQNLIDLGQQDPFANFSQNKIKKEITLAILSSWIITLNIQLWQYRTLSDYHSEGTAQLLQMMFAAKLNFPSLAAASTAGVQVPCRFATKCIIFFPGKSIRRCFLEGELEWFFGDCSMTTVVPECSGPTTLWQLLLAVVWDGDKSLMNIHNRY